MDPRGEAGTQSVIAIAAAWVFLVLPMVGGGLWLLAFPAPDSAGVELGFGALSVFLGGLIGLVTVNGIKANLAADLFRDVVTGVSPGRAEPGDVLELSLDFTLARAARVKAITASLKRREVCQGEDVDYYDIVEIGQVQIRGAGQLYAHLRQEFAGQLQLPESATLSAPDDISWIVEFVVDVEGFPDLVREAPLEVVPRQPRPPEAEVAFRAEVEAWLPEFLEVALADASGRYDERQRAILKEVAKRRGVGGGA